MKPPHKDYECPKCGGWIEILPTTPLGIFDCPWCDEPLTLDPNIYKSKLISARPHMEAMIKHAEAKNVT